MKKKVLTQLDGIQKDDVVLLLGIPLFFNEALQKKLQDSQAQVIYMNPIDYKDSSIQFSHYIKYEVGSEEGICALLLNYFVEKSTEEIQAYIENLDIGYLSAETSLGEEELEELVLLCQKAPKSYLVLSEDFLGHKKADNIVKMLGVLNNYTPLNLVLLKPSLNNLAIDLYDKEPLEEIESLDSFNGLVICKNSFIDANSLRGGVSFSAVAKIGEKEELLIHFEEKTLKRVFVLDPNLQGTVALCSQEGMESLAYSYKQVKIEKVEE